jgi:hypothetical protein
MQGAVTQARWTGDPPAQRACYQAAQRYEVHQQIHDVIESTHRLAAGKNRLLFEANGGLTIAYKG